MGCPYCHKKHEDTEWFMGYDDDNQEYRMWTCGDCQEQWWEINS